MLCNSAKVIRSHLFNSEEVFNVDLSLQIQEKSVPKELVHLFGLILEGTSEYEKFSGNSKRLAVNIAQIIRFNAVRTKRPSENAHIRHSKTNEPPLL